LSTDAMKMKSSVIHKINLRYNAIYTCGFFSELALLVLYPIKETNLPKKIITNYREVTRQKIHTLL